MKRQKAWQQYRKRFFPEKNCFPKWQSVQWIEGKREKFCQRTQRFFFIYRLILIKLAHQNPNLPKHQSMFEDFVWEFVPAEARWGCRKRDTNAENHFPRRIPKDSSFAKWRKISEIFLQYTKHPHQQWWALQRIRSDQLQLFACLVLTCFACLHFQTTLNRTVTHYL